MNGGIRRAGAGLLFSVVAAFPWPAAAGRSSPIILISIDTLRADHLGCYGYRKIRTPHLDELTKRGTLFTRVDSPVPMTLPAHLSLLTSSYPFVHHVEENGRQVPHGISGLPAVLKAHGFRTAAFIGGYVLDKRFGMDEGFEVYDSPFHLRPDNGQEPPEVKRSAEEVLRAAAEWMEAQPGHPFFAFIHLYDVHQPYAHGGYDAEIAYVDQAIGRFEKIAGIQKILDDAVIVVTTDHGESLGEHGEETHGYFIYESTLRVPLIARWPTGAPEYAARVQDPASLIDIAPTLLDFLGISAPAQFQGQSLMTSLGPHTSMDRPIFAESMYARDHLGCAPLRSIRLGRHKYIDAPTPELYDLETDPGEMQNRYQHDRNVASVLKARLVSIEQGGNRVQSGTAGPDVASRLRSLGYLGGGPPRSGSGADPKERLREYLRYGRGIRLANTGRLPEAITEFEKVLEEDAKNSSAQFYVAVCYYRLKRLDDAVRALDATLAISPDYPPAEELLGTIWLLRQDYGRARQQFEHLERVAPDNFGAHFNLGIFALREGRMDAARRELDAAIRTDPGSGPAHAALGSVYYSQGDWSRANDELRQAVAIDPRDESSRKALEEIQKAHR